MADIIRYTYQGNLEGVKGQLAAGVSINFRDSDGYTALIWASDNGRMDIVKYLLQHGADINIKSNGGWTALIGASFNGHLDTVMYLHQHGADINIKDKDGVTALMWASRGGHLDIVKYLHQHGADINIKSNVGGTALIGASDKGHLDIVKYLHQHGADINIKNKNGKTALDYARSNGHTKVVEYLETAQSGGGATSQREQQKKAAEEAEQQRKATEESERRKRLAAEEAERQRKITELAEDIQDLKAFLNAECGLTKAASGRCAEALAVDHGLGTVVVMKCEGREELTMILKSIGLSDKETELVLKVTHPVVPSNTAVVSNLGAISTLPPISVANGGAKAATAPSSSSKSSLVSLPSIKIAPQVATPLFSLPPDILYHVFITHDWGTDELGRNNHETNILLNEALKARGFNTWFDADRMEGNIVQQMADGIEKSACVLVAITQRYMAKVSGTNDNDNCKIEFVFAQRNKGASKMIPVPIEPRCMSPQAWTGPVGGILGGQLYQANLAFDITADRARFEAEVDKIVARIGAICSKL